jgi:hypothetical protein
MRAAINGLVGGAHIARPPNCDGGVAAVGAACGSLPPVGELADGVDLVGDDG